MHWKEFGRITKGYELMQTYVVEVDGRMIPEKYEAYER